MSAPAVTGRAYQLGAGSLGPGLFAMMLHGDYQQVFRQANPPPRAVPLPGGQPLWHDEMHHQAAGVTGGEAWAERHPQDDLCP